MKLALCLVLALACAAHADTSGRFFEDCTSTTMRLVNRKRFVGGDVYRSVKLTAAQGTLFCENLCRADENCWSFNLNKNRKVCFLMTSGNDVTSQRATTWSSGYRECVPSEGNWDNPNTVAADDAAVLLAATGGSGKVDVTWTLAANDAYYTATYKAIIVADGLTCDATPLASLDVAAEGTSASITTTVTGPVETFVQTIVDGTVRGCSSGLGASVS